MKAAMERFNAAVLQADLRLRWKGDRQDPENLWLALIHFGWIPEARELLEAGKPLGYFKTWTDAECETKP